MSAIAIQSQDQAKQLKTPLVVGIVSIYAIGLIGEGRVRSHFGGAYVPFFDAVMLALLAFWSWGLMVKRDVQRSGWTRRPKIMLCVAIFGAAGFVFGVYSGYLHLPSVGNALNMLAIAPLFWVSASSSGQQGWNRRVALRLSLSATVIIGCLWLLFATISRSHRGKGTDVFTTRVTSPQQ